jgi:hypothetical protein
MSGSPTAAQTPRQCPFVLDSPHGTRPASPGEAHRSDRHRVASYVPRSAHAVVLSRVQGGDVEPIQPSSTCIRLLSHDSEEHRRNIADLTQGLRRQGINAAIDQFVESDPPLSWPRWMQDQIESANYVLLIITETYARRFRGRETPGHGLGVRWEGAIITSELYYAGDDRVKFIPVVVSPVDVRLIPSPLSLTSWYVCGTPGNRDLTALLRHLRGQPALLPEPLTPPTGSAHVDSSSRDSDALQSFAIVGDCWWVMIPRHEQNAVTQWPRRPMFDARVCPRYMSPAGRALGQLRSAAWRRG